MCKLYLRVLRGLYDHYFVIKLTMGEITGTLGYVI